MSQNVCKNPLLKGPNCPYWNLCMSWSLSLPWKWWQIFSNVIKVSKLWLKLGTDWYILSKSVFMNLPMKIEIISFWCASKLSFIKHIKVIRRFEFFAVFLKIFLFVLEFCVCDAFFAVTAFPRPQIPFEAPFWAYQCKKY